MAGTTSLPRRRWLPIVAAFAALLFFDQDSASGHRVWNVLAGDSFTEASSNLLPDYVIHAIALDYTRFHEPSLLIFGRKSHSSDQIYRISLSRRAKDRRALPSALSTFELAAGNGQGYSSNPRESGGLATQTPLRAFSNRPAVLANGDLAFIEDCTTGSSGPNLRIRHISRSTGIITTLVGSDEEIQLGNGEWITISPLAIATSNNDLLVSGHTSDKTTHVWKISKLPGRAWKATSIIGGGEKPLSDEFQNARSIALDGDVGDIVARPDGTVIASLRKKCPGCRGSHSQKLLETRAGSYGNLEARVVALANLPPGLHIAHAQLALENDGHLLLTDSTKYVLRANSDLSEVRVLLSSTSQIVTPQVGASIVNSNWMPWSVIAAPDGGLFVLNGFNQLLYIDNDDGVGDAVEGARVWESHRNKIERDIASKLVRGIQRRADQTVSPRDVVSQAAYKRPAANPPAAPFALAATANFTSTSSPHRELDRQVLLSQLPRELLDQLEHYVEYNFTLAFFERMRAEMAVERIGTNPEYKDLRKHLWWSSWASDLLSRAKSWVH